MKVIHILWSGEIGGAERAVAQLAAYQRENDTFDVAIGFGRAEGEFARRARTDGVCVHDFQLKSGHDLRSVRRIRRVLAGYDVHHFHCAEIVVIMASLLCRKVRRIYTHRGGLFSYPPRQALRYALLAPIFRHFFAVTGTAQAARAVEELFRIPRSSVVRTFNGVDADTLKPSQDPHLLRAQFGIPGSTVVIGTAANLRSLKRIDSLIRAVASLSQDDYRLIVLGDGPALPDLTALAEATLPQGRGIFPGMVTNVGDWLAIMDIFALPSGPEESFGNAAVEAMTVGLPVLVRSDSPALAEHVIDGRTGFVVGDERELSVRLQQLVNDPSLRTTLGAAARETVVRRYTMEGMAAAFRGLYVQAPVVT